MPKRTKRESVGVKNEEQLAKPPKEVFVPTEAVRNAVLLHRRRFEKAKQARNQRSKFLDGMTFTQDYNSNVQAANSYLRPKINDDEVRVVGGATEKRIESVANELESMNIQHEVEAYDQNDLEVAELGRAIGDTVTRTNQQEKDEDTWTEAIWELCTQRAVFLEEILDEVKFGNKIVKQCRKRLRTSQEVFLGELTLPAHRIQDQPYIVLYDQMSYWRAKELYGHYDNFQYVRPGPNTDNDVFGTDITFRLGILDEESVEVIKYLCVPDNESQIYVGAVPMLPIGEKMPFQYPRPHYNLAMAIPKRMSAHYSYGRPLTAAMKYLQALGDEMVRNVIRKFRQAIEPPKAVQASNHIYSREMYNAGKITYGVNADLLKPLTDHNGVTDGEMRVLDMVKMMQDELSARGNTSIGIPPEAVQSATATIEQQKQAIKMLGQAVIALTRLRRDVTELRIYSIIENLMTPTGLEKDPISGNLRAVYRRFTLKGQALEDGKMGDRIVQFSDKNLSDEEQEQLMDWEDLQDKKGTPTRVSHLNVKAIKNAPIAWYIRAVSKPQESDQLNRLMFNEKLDQATKVSQVAGQPLNGERVAAEFQQTWGLKDWYIKPSEQTSEMGMEEMAASLGMDQGGSAMQQQAQAGVRAPLDTAKRMITPKQPTMRRAMAAA